MKSVIPMTSTRSSFLLLFSFFVLHVVAIGASRASLALTEQGIRSQSGRGDLLQHDDHDSRHIHDEHPRRELIDSSDAAADGTGSLSDTARNNKKEEEGQGVAGKIEMKSPSTPSLRGNDNSIFAGHIVKDHHVHSNIRLAAENEDGVKAEEDFWDVSSWGTGKWIIAVVIALGVLSCCCLCLCCFGCCSLCG